ncbi:MAG: ribonuclease P protein component [Alistipes sp.]|nr:ribonuclease P protein component [Alistipes sp.]
MPDYSLPRNERLRSFTTIRRVFSEGKGGFVYPFRYTFLVTKLDKAEADSVEADKENASIDKGRIEVMFSVPKKFHKRANKRNLLKRRTREAYRLSREELRCKVAELGVVVDVAIVYSTKEIHSYKTISYAVQRILEQIGSRL